MKSLVRLFLLFMMATLAAGCAASAVDSPPINNLPASVSVVGSHAVSVPIPAPGATSVPASVPVVASAPVPPAGNNSPTEVAAAYIPMDVDRQEMHDLRAADKAMTTASHAANASALVSKPPHPFEGTELYVHLPPQVKPQQPLRVLLVLHGMGGSGEPFSQSLLREAERNNWVLVAPTLAYRDYMDPQQLMEDDIQLGKRIADTLDVLPQRLNLKLRQHILIFSYSRGAQLAHRFAYFYPERIESIVTLSAGAYTLPLEKRPGDKVAQVIPFPFGIGDLNEYAGHPVNWQALKKVSFWIGVGQEDNQANDVSRAFDSYVGKTRLERAKAFHQALLAVGIDVRLVVFPDATHDLTSQMRLSALQFLCDRELVDHWDD